MSVFNVVFFAFDQTIEINMLQSLLLCKKHVNEQKHLESGF